jgi:hypothetical protein
MSEVNTSEMWQKWMGEVLNVVAPNGLGDDQTFSGGSGRVIRLLKLFKNYKDTHRNFNKG